MPFYDYYCEKNKRTVEVFLSSTKKLKTWGQLCKAAGIEPGKTSKDTPVVRMISNVTPKVFKLKGIDKDEPRGKLEV